MDLELVGSVELLGAVHAIIQLDVLMASLVIFPVPVGAESLTTVIASKWLLFGVSADVVNQTCLVPKNLFALSEGTLVGQRVLRLVAGLSV
jgi:hypothetical protein